ncbi:MAG: PQQ-binding-like beta-propeller repeat protein, partial [Planctomycetes bacterium]|nr:PQQ-binding-like beta-propeller repeat protein [Planctomycetota bacterium]
MVRLNVLILTILATFSADSAGNLFPASGIKGGFVVHVGCGNGMITAALRKNDAFIIHGLDTDPANVQEAREHILAGKYNGTVSVAEFDGRHLPYVDNMVNFMLCTQRYDLSDEEIMRVLAPRGKAVMQTGVRQRTLTKPWPDNYDEWNHYLHDPDNNAVSKDSAIKAPITHLQWKAGPMYSRHHDKSVTHMPALASARGKIFYIIDNGPRASVLWPANFQLTARDAFNGVVLWQKDIEQWIDHLAYDVKKGPAVNTRRLVAVGDYVYVTLGVFAPVSKLDAHTGRVVKTYKGTEKTEEILVKDGVVYLVINPSVSDQSPKNFILEQNPKIAMAVKQSDGTILWQNELSWIAPSTLTLGENNVYLCNGPEIIAHNRKTGKQLWKSQQLPWRQEMPTYFAPTLVAVPGALLYVGGENWYEHAGSKGLMTCL